MLSRVRRCFHAWPGQEDEEGWQGCRTDLHTLTDMVPTPVPCSAPARSPGEGEGSSEMLN